MAARGGGRAEEVASRVEGEVDVAAADGGAAVGPAGEACDGAVEELLADEVGVEEEWGFGGVVVGRKGDVDVDDVAVAF